VKLIAADDAVVSAEAIRRSTNMKIAAAVPPLARVLAGGNVGQRQLAVQALSAIGSPGALQALEKAIDDSDREVRVGAVRTLGGRAYRGVFARIEAAVKGKALRDADLTERMAFFEAFGAMCGDSGVAFLDDILHARGLFGKREDPELRACAAIALGRIGSRKAQESLQKAAGEKDVVVRNAVNRALRPGS
jgi:HEAT repeat protein